MKSALVTLLLAILLPLNAVAIQLYTFYAECELGLIDTASGTSTPAGNVGWSIEAMDYGPDGLLYATVENGCWTHGNADWLATVDPATHTVFPIGPIDPAGVLVDVDALAFHPDGRLFGVSMSTYQLITIDPASGLGTPVDHIGNLPGTFLGAIDFLPDGTLLLIDMADAGGGPSTLWTLDLVTADGTFIGPLGFDSVEGMSVGPDGQVYALAKSMEGQEPAMLVTVDPGSGAGTFVQFMPLPLPAYEGARDALVALPRIEVAIDIKPWSWPNSINLRNQGVIPVAILTTSIAAGDSVDFDALEINPATARFGPAGAAMFHDSAHAEDVDLDGDLDLVMQFLTGDTGIACGDTTASLVADTYAGVAVIGTDAVRTVACH